MAEVKERMQQRAQSGKKKKKKQPSTGDGVPPTGHPMPRIPTSHPGLDLRIRPPSPPRYDDTNNAWSSPSRDNNDDELPAARAPPSRRRRPRPAPTVAAIPSAKPVPRTPVYDTDDNDDVTPRTVSPSAASQPQPRQQLPSYDSKRSEPPSRQRRQPPADTPLRESKQPLAASSPSPPRLPYDPANDDDNNPLYHPSLAPMTPEVADALVAAIPETYVHHHHPIECVVHVAHVMSCMCGV